MSKSFKDKPEFIKSEMDSLRAHGLEPKIMEHEHYPNRIVFECTIPKDVLGNNTGEPIELEIVFPDNFPHFRPQVFGKNLNLPRHQNPISKDLCLLARETLNWDIQSIGSYLQKQLPKVLIEGLETDPAVIAAIPNEQAEPVSEYYSICQTLIFTSGKPLIMNEAVPDFSSELQILDSGKLKVETKQNPSTVELGENSTEPLVFNICEWLNNKGEIIESDFQSYFSAIKNKTLTWYQLSKFPDEIYGEDFILEFSKMIKRDNALSPQTLQLQTGDFNLLQSFCIIFPEEHAAGDRGWGWIHFTVGQPRNRSKSNPHLKTLLGSKIQVLSKTEYFNRIPQVRNFQEKTVGLLGVGAIGAPIAIELAKNGIKTLKILDCDRLEAQNSVRWPLGLDYIGYTKVDALNKFLSLNYPFTNVTSFNHKIGDLSYKVDENKLLADFFNECDVIIDATVENGVNHLISNRCRNLNIPYILAEGRRGGWGGLVARILPGQTRGCWTCLQNKLYNETEEEPITKPPDDQNGDMQQAGCGDITFTGTHFDLVNVSYAVVKILANMFSDDDTFDWDIAVLKTVNNDENIAILPEWKTHPLLVSKNCPYEDDLHS